MDVINCHPLLTHFIQQTKGKFRYTCNMRKNGNCLIINHKHRRCILHFQHSKLRIETCQLGPRLGGIVIELNDPNMLEHMVTFITNHLRGHSHRR